MEETESAGEEIRYGELVVYLPSSPRGVMSDLRRDAFTASYVPELDRMITGSAHERTVL